MAGHRGMLGNEMVDLLATKESQTKLIGPEPYFSLSYKPVRQVGPGGLVVTILASGSKVSGFKSGQG